MSSIHDVARRAQVSTATVSRVFNGATNIRPSTKEHVLSVAKTLNYFPDSSARNLSRRREGRDALTYTIGIVSFRASLFGLDPFSAEMLAGMEAALRERGFVIRLIQCSLESSALPSVLTNKEVDGVVCFQAGKRVREIAKLVPTVTLDGYDPDSDAYGVVPDYRSGVYAAVKSLLASGHRRIELVAGAPGAPDAPVGDPLFFPSQVHAGCAKAFAEAGLEFVPGKATRMPGEPAAGYELGRELFARTERPDAVIASDGSMPGLIRAAHEAGVKIPADCSFIGIDGVAAMEFLWPPLTTVDTHIRSLGITAVKALTDMIFSGERKRGVEITPVTLVKRASARIG